MPVVSELLHRIGEQDRGVYAPGDPRDRIAAWDRAPRVRAWRGWAEGQHALGAGDPSTAASWLGAAESWAPAPPDEVLQGELALAWARLLNQIDEPRRALEHAESAWMLWIGLARDPRPALTSGSLVDLVAALTYPEQLVVPPQQLVVDWMSDRVAPNLHRSARAVFDACRGVGDAAPAETVASEWRAWFRSTSAAGGLRPEQLAPLEAAVVRDLANLRDQLGDAQAALAGFREALALRSAPGVAPDAVEARQLEFNIANQLAKLGQHAEAIAAFERLAPLFAAAGEAEPTLRCRHAALVSRWSAGETPAALLAPLEEVLLSYERILAKREDDGPDSAAALNLRQGNRLWLSLAARLLGSAVPAERFLQQLYATRSANARGHTAWQRVAARSAPVVIGQMNILLARLAREDRGLRVLSLESAVNEVLAVTLSGGALSSTERLSVEPLSAAAADALRELILARRELTQQIASRAVPEATAPAPAFVGACQALWIALPARTQECLASATVVYLVPEAEGALDEAPLELLHDGQQYLGLRVPIVRAASWEQLGYAFAPNRVDAQPGGHCALVRGAAVPALGPLPEADAELEQVEALAHQSFASVERLTEPTTADVDARLSAGLDVLHYTGHSYADDAGESLVLRADALMGVPELGAWRARPAPVSFFCSCLVGLHRQTRRGLARGIAGALLEAGAPAVVAATVSLPDRVARDFAVAVHFHARSRPLGAALLAARTTLAQRLHPATWACFVLFGRHDASLVAPAATAPRDWPSLLLRCLACRGTAWRVEVAAAMQQDPRLPPALVAQVQELVSRYAAGTDHDAAPAFDATVVAGLAGDERLALTAASALTEAVCGDEDRARAALGRVLLMHQVLDDHYLFVAVVDAGIRAGILLVQSENSQAFVERAALLHGWLDRSAEGLGPAREAVAAVRAQWAQSVTIRAPELAGVDEGLFQRADAGDRDAAKDILWNLKSRAASPAARASDLPWMHWLYRMMGADGEGPTGDFCGVVDAAARSGRLAARQADALRTLFKRYVGPGEIEPPCVAAALDCFAGQAAETAAIRQFELYDRITSQEREVPAEAIAQGQAQAERAGADGLAAFLRLQLGARALADRDFQGARALAEAALHTWIGLEQRDPAYTERANLGAAFLYNVAQASGDKALSARVRKKYANRIQAYAEAQRGS